MTVVRLAKTGRNLGTIKGQANFLGTEIMSKSSLIRSVLAAALAFSFSLGTSADVTVLPGPTGDFVVRDSSQTDRLIVGDNGVAVPGMTGSTGAVVCASNTDGTLGTCAGNSPTLFTRVIANNASDPMWQAGTTDTLKAYCPKGQAAISCGMVVVDRNKPGASEMAMDSLLPYGDHCGLGFYNPTNADVEMNVFVEAICVPESLVSESQVPQP